MVYKTPKCAGFIAEKTCSVCSVEFTPDNRAQVYCSGYCRSKAQRTRNAASTGKPHWRDVGKTCGICGIHFMPPTKMSSNAKYCSDKCRVEGIRNGQKRFNKMHPEAQSIYNRAREMVNGKSDGLLCRLYKKYPDLPTCCEACGLDELDLLEAAHKPGFERKGAHRVMKHYERHMFWMLCPNDHKRIDKKLKTPADLGLT